MNIPTEIMVEMEIFTAPMHKLTTEYIIDPYNSNYAMRVKSEELFSPVLKPFIKSGLTIEEQLELLVEQEVDNLIERVSKGE